MKIKNRLSLYFTLIGSSALLVVLVSIYLSFYTYLHNDFFSHLKDRATVAAQLYLEADEITPDSLSHVRGRFLKALPGEIVRFYDSRNEAAFIKDDQQYWNSKIIETVRRKKYFQYDDNDSQVVGIYYPDNQGNFVILVSAIDHEGIQRMQILFRTMLVFFFAVGALLFIASRWMAMKALLSIQNVVKQMNLIKASNLHLRVDEGNGKDEISELARNFNRLIERLESAFELQKIYVVNASHELRTPVTTIIGELELALSKERDDADNRQTMNLVLQESIKLKETIADLMELAQVDMDYTVANLAPVRTDELLWELNEYWSNKYGADKFKIVVHNMPDDDTILSISANRQLLMIAMNNLISNAYKFSDGKPVTCTFFADETHICIEIIDQGIGLPPDDFERVFQSFYRSNNARYYPGNGIGLYIARKIINLFNGNVTFKPTNGPGAIVSVDFKF